MSKTPAVSESLSTQPSAKTRRVQQRVRQGLAPLLLTLAVAPSAWAQAGATAATSQAQPTNTPAAQPATAQTPASTPTAAATTPASTPASTSTTPASTAGAPSTTTGTASGVSSGSAVVSTTPATAAEATNAPAATPSPSGASASAPTAAVPAQPASPTQPPSDCKQEWSRDGFYLRAVFSSGYVGFDGTGPAGKPSIVGFGGGNIFAIGGSLTKGLVLAGTIQVSQVGGKFKGGPYQDATFVSGGEEKAVSQNATAVFSQIGALIDWYPTQSGFHLAIGGGFTSIGLQLNADGETLVGTGSAGTLLLGYDWPISRTIAFGINLTAAATSRITLKYDGERTSGYELAGKSIGIGGSFLYF